MDRSLLAELLTGTEGRLTEMDHAIERQKDVIARLAASGEDVTQLTALLGEVQHLRQLMRGNKDWLMTQIQNPSSSDPDVD